MKTYEALYIVRPDVADDDVQTIAKEVEQLIAGQNGAIVRSEIWGKRRLAYEVQKCAEGYYILLRFAAPPSFIGRLENHFRLTDTIIRYLVVHFDEKTLRLEAQQKKRKEAEVRASTAAPPRERDDEEDDDRDRPRRPARRFAAEDDEDEAVEE